MCEATAFLITDDGRENIYLKDVDVIHPKGKTLYLRDIFGEQREIEAEIEEISLLNHRILLRQRVGLNKAQKKGSINRP
jgi:predicted RNA-binding protein